MVLVIKLCLKTTWYKLLMKIYVKEKLLGTNLALISSYWLMEFTFWSKAMVVVLVHSKREEFTWQKETLFQPKLQGGRMSVKSQEKRKIRKNSKISKRRVLATSSTLSISQATSSSSSQPSFRSMRKQCLKCQGWIVSQSIDLSEKIETRCLNCGWQPRYGARTRSIQVGPLTSGLAHPGLGESHLPEEC